MSSSIYGNGGSNTATSTHGGPWEPSSTSRTATKTATNQPGASFPGPGRCYGSNSSLGPIGPVSPRASAQESQAVTTPSSQSQPPGTVDRFIGGAKSVGYSIGSGALTGGWWATKKAFNGVKDLSCYVGAESYAAAKGICRLGWASLEEHTCQDLGSLGAQDSIRILRASRDLSADQMRSKVVALKSTHSESAQGAFPKHENRAIMATTAHDSALDAYVEANPASEGLKPSVSVQSASSSHS